MLPRFQWWNPILPTEGKSPSGEASSVVRSSSYRLSTANDPNLGVASCFCEVLLPFPLNLKDEVQLLRFVLVTVPLKLYWHSENRFRNDVHVFARESRQGSSFVHFCAVETKNYNCALFKPTRHCLKLVLGKSIEPRIGGGSSYCILIFEPGYSFYSPEKKLLFTYSQSESTINTILSSPSLVSWFISPIC